jgi:hypothetical protein
LSLNNVTKIAFPELKSNSLLDHALINDFSFHILIKIEYQYEQTTMIMVSLQMYIIQYEEQQKNYISMQRIMI